MRSRRPPSRDSGDAAGGYGRHGRLSAVGLLDGLGHGVFQGGRQRTLPRLVLFRKKNVVILKTTNRAGVAGGATYICRQTMRPLRDYGDTLRNPFIEGELRNVG